MASIETVEGIGVKHGRALRKAGVRTTAALLREGGAKKGRKSANLHATMLETNIARRRPLVRRSPSLGEVERSVAHAQELDPMVSHWGALG